ncbi:MAG: DNA mismatch repair endonuclease MutL [Anaerolineae bacterium]|nr:DNA mismatch repair endonuclease MutL [Anaerolineae bacterium]
MPIHILPEDVASKIAAGEVIERPASVVKELIENAIDAGAHTVHVEIRQAGRRLIRISDDGCGIPADEIEVAFARHATSKLDTVDDLEHIRTLGFRGEALASIAAVAQVTLTTSTGQSQVGTRVRVDGGEFDRPEPIAHPRGTTIGVENLFFNVPARLKFLRADATERKHIETLLTRYAMAYSGVRFSVENDGRLTFRSPGSGDLRDVLIQVYGLSTAQGMLFVEAGGGEHQVCVSGYVSPPDEHRATRSEISLFVNGRWIQDSSLAYAVEQAYHTLLPQGRHPLAAIKIDLPPEEVDVNVHPAKSEVKFQRRDAVFRAVQRAVRSALIEQSPIPTATGPAQSWGVDGWQERREALIGASASQAAATQATLDLISSAQSDSRWEGEFEAGATGQAKLPPLRAIGQIGRTYIIAEGPEGMYLIDQHAAHERVMYERLLAQHEASDVPVQTLLEPLAVELTPGQVDEMALWLDGLHALGFEIEPFGPNTVLVRALPALLARGDVRELLVGIVDELSLGEEPLAEDVHRRIAAAACKQGAVKAGQTLSAEEVRGLIEQLEQTTSPRTCPHGRPTMILLSQGWLEREFGRR